MSSGAPIHPGTLIEPLLLQRSGLSQSMLARQMGFNQPQPVNELVKGRRGITPKMALLLERCSDGAYPAQFWLLAQLRWDLAQARDTLSASRLALVQRLELEGEAVAAATEAGQEKLLQLAATLEE